MVEFNAVLQVNEFKQNKKRLFANQILFYLLILSLCWLLFQVVHEFGHVLGAVVSGGTVQTVILHPLVISRTDVAPNPSPLVVVWAGPIMGSLIPLVTAMALHRVHSTWPTALKFFAGFCLIANGAYIGLACFDQVGDCRVMIQNGTPVWQMLTFGLVTVSIGFLNWHRLGSPSALLKEDCMVKLSDTLIAAAVFLILVVFECVSS